MKNFIEDLDKKYKIERAGNGIKGRNKNFWIFSPIIIKLYGKENSNFLLKKGEFTKVLYIKDGCRVYFSDADILTMLLQIKDKNTICLLLENLRRLYQLNGEKYNIVIGNEEYEVTGIAQVKDEQILTNPMDIDISFEELLVLINLILSKDIEAAPLWKNKPNFRKHTLAKYLSIIKYYYFGDNKAERYLFEMGYDTKVDIYSNYDTTGKRNEKNSFFKDFHEFEKSGIL